MTVEVFRAQSEQDREELFRFRYAVNVLGPGDVFGEMAFLLELLRQSDVYAATPDVKILSLSDGTLHKLMAEEPSLAAKLLLNISRMLCGRLIKANAGADI